MLEILSATQLEKKNEKLLLKWQHLIGSFDQKYYSKTYLAERIEDLVIYAEKHAPERYRKFFTDNGPRIIVELYIQGCGRRIDDIFREMLIALLVSEK